MRIKYRVIRARPAVIAAMFLVICICVGFVGALGKTVAAWSPNAKHPIYSVETDKPHVSLGINCAWDNEDIPELLAILAHHDIKATFFIAGDWCDKFPESVKLIHEAGHEIGSHSDTHADMTKLGDERILREIHSSKAKLEKITGMPVTLFRPPSGAYNAHVIELIEQQDMYPIQWDCDLLHMKTIN